MSQFDLPLGDAANPTVRFPAGTILRAAEIEGNYRWTQTRTWGAGPCLHWNLLNPSDADALRDDPTTLRMIGFSYRWGFGSMLVTNVYPFISASPEAMRRWRAQWAGDDWSGGLVWPMDNSALSAWLHNMDVVRAAIRKTDVHVAAWGNGVDDDDMKNFLDEVTWEYDTVGPARYTVTADDGYRIPVEWKCIGKTGSGAPIHPLARGLSRVPDDAQLQVWRTS